MADANEKISHSIIDTEKIAEEFANKIPPPGKHATVIAFYGDLGTGKTTFIQTIGKKFGVRESVQSPTFVIIKSYKLEGGDYKFFIHVDAYRLEGGDELRKLGFEKSLGNSGNLVLIEWANKVEDIIPKDAIKIRIDHIAENERRLKIDFGGSVA